jgi:hypothetical protein
VAAAAAVWAAAVECSASWLTVPAYQRKSLTRLPTPFPVLCRPATPAAKAPKGAIAKPKGRSGKSGTRQRILGATPGRRAGGLNIPFEQLYLCHLGLLSMTKKVRVRWCAARLRSACCCCQGACLVKATPPSHFLSLTDASVQQLAQQHGIRTDSLWEKVQAMLREVRPRLKPEGRSVISEVRCGCVSHGAAMRWTHAARCHARSPPCAVPLCR